jgi:hypothetical protein
MTHTISEGNKIELHSGRSNSDILFCCASFEPRSTAVLKNLSDEFRAKTGVIYYNKELQSHAPERLSDNLEYLEDRMSCFCDEILLIEGSINNPITQLNELRRSLTLAESHSDNIDSITVDVTTFNRESLLTLLNLIKSWYPTAELDILYVSPSTYGDWLSRGHKTIRNVLGFTGSHTSDQSTALVVLSGFETDRTYKVIEEIEPAVVHLGFGDTPTQQKFLERNKHRQEMVQSRQDTFRFNFAADDIDRCRKVVQNKVEENHDDYNIILAPMSTKLSTIGCWKAAQEYPRSQVIYALPGEYNYDGYSEGSKHIYSDSFWLEQ